MRQRDEAEAALVRVGCGAPEQDERPNRLTLPAPREASSSSRTPRPSYVAPDRRQRHGLRRPTLDDVLVTGEAPSENGKPQSAGSGRPRRSWSVLATRVGTHRRCEARDERHRQHGRDDAEPSPLPRPDLLVFSTIQPIGLVVLFVYVFGGAVGLALPPGVAAYAGLPTARDLRSVGDVPRV